MAAHEDSNNKPKCKTNVNNDRERDFVRVYKKLEQVLNNKNEQFQKKVESLIEAWKQVFHYSHAVKDLCFVQLMDWTKFHTLNLVLNGDWKNYKDVYENKLLCEVKSTENALLKLNNLFSLRCKKLAEVIKDPWGNPILNKLLNNPEAHIGPKEIEFFCLETGYLVSHRLKKLCEQHCEDLALNFVSAFIRCLSLAESQQFTLNTTEQQKWFIMDIYIALLFKYKRFPQMITSLKQMSLADGCELVKRFSNKRVKISKVWRHSQKIAQMACQIFVTSAVMMPLEQGGEKLKQLLDIWFSYKETELNLDSVGDAIRKIVHAAESAEQMYIICDVLHKKFNLRAKIILVELLVRGLTTDMNRLENLKHEENIDEESNTKTRMSLAFDKLSRILEDKIEVARECALTGFSLTPTEERLKLIENFARRSGCNVDVTAKEWTCRLHPPVLPSDEVSWKCDVCGDYMSQPKLETALNTTNTLLCEALRPEQLGLDPLLCDDLAVLLSSPKYHLLSWLLSWPDLHRMCVMYLRNPQSIKNIVSVLEYAEPDYSLYMRPIKREPLDEDDIHTGIEKGYEHFLVQSEGSEASDTESAPESAMYDTELTQCGYLPGPPLETFKSYLPISNCNDEGTSKTTHTTKLRQYRKSTKRVKEMSPIEVPDKLIRMQQFPVTSNFTKCTVKMQGTENIALMQRPCVSYERLPEVGYWDITGRYHPDGVNEHSDCPEDLSVPRVEIQQKIPQIVPNQSKDLCDEFEEFLASVCTTLVTTSFKKTDIQANCDKSDVVRCGDRTDPKFQDSLSTFQSDIIDKTESTNTSVINKSEIEKKVRSDTLNTNVQVNAEEQINVATDTVDITVKSEKISGLKHKHKDKSETFDITDCLETPPNAPKETADIIDSLEVKLNIKQEPDNFFNTTDIINSKEKKISDKCIESLLHVCLTENKSINLKRSVSPELPKVEAQKKTPDPPILKPYYERSHSGSKLTRSLCQSVVRQIAAERNQVNEISPPRLAIEVPYPKRCSPKPVIHLNESNSSSSNTIVNVPFNCGEKTEKVIQTKKQPVIMLKEATVILNRININQYLNKKSRKRTRSDTESTENKKAIKHSMVEKSPHNSFPLQDKNPRVEIKRKDQIECKKAARKTTERRKSSRKKKRPQKKNINKGEKDKKWHIQRNNNSFSPKTLDQLMKSPKVILEKLRLDDVRIKKSVLANVPGLNDLGLIRPERNNRVVQVVQVSGGRPTSTVTSQNSQTSTQITPHIQRIGQPRVDKPPVPENSDSTIVATSQPDIKATRSQPSTLINILSHQVVAPAQTGTNRINILSHHLIKPSTTSTESAMKTNTATTSRTSKTSRMSADWQIISQVDEGYTKRTITTRQTVTQANLQQNDQNRIVQFVCKSNDTKAIPVTSTASNRNLKITTTQSDNTTTTINSNFEQGFSKFAKQKSSDEAETLPKFQQAFGKSAYQNNVDSNNVDAEKKVAKTTTSGVQPIQGSVIYARQVPVGQAINLIPQGRGQVFRIATTNSDPTVIHSKMSALLAAALQGKPKSTETGNTETVVVENNSSVGTSIRSTLSAQIVKPVLTVPTTRSNNPQPNLSSTTLEQLREFDMVYKQVKERSSTNTGNETVATETNEGQRMNVTFVGQGQKFTQISPVVVVSSYCNLQPAASPALSVTSQGSSSPCVTSASSSSLSKVAVKNSKGKTVKNATTNASKTSPIPKPQQKPQEDEHTTQRIFDILAEYAEQLRNSPDLNNKPAPRRRSNPPTNPNQNSKRKKNNSSKKSGQCSSTISSDADVDDPRTMGSEDSSCGVVQISMPEEEQSTANTQTSEASSETSVSSCQPLILSDSSHNQTRNVIITESSVGEALKMPSTAVLVPGNYIMPVSMVKSGQQIAVVSGGSKILATVPARTGPNMLLFQSFLNQNRKSGIPTVKYSTIQPLSGISSSTISGVTAQPPVILPSTSHSLSAVALGQPITIKKINEQNNSELLLAIPQSQFTQQTTETNNIQSNNNQNISAVEPNKPQTTVDATFQKSIITTPIATSVISQTVSVKEDQPHQEQHSEITQNISIPTQDVSKDEPAKVERVQSVLVTASSSNGPMLAHSEHTTNAGPKSYKAEFYRIVEMQQASDTKQQFQTNVTYYNKPKKQTQPTIQKQERDVHQLSLQRKQAAIERELRLQKSLSEECEDLGVDEPSTSDLFPEADLLFDNNQSPSFEQIAPKRAVLLTEISKEETKLFSGEDSSSVGASLLFESIEYATPDTVFEYGPQNQVSNGQSSVSNDTASSGEDNTVLHQCASVSDMTLNSPATDDPYLEQQPSANKYKYKYSNRKKLERHKQQEIWPQEASSSEDTTGSTDMKRSSHSPEMCSNKRCDEELEIPDKDSPNTKEEEGCVETRCEKHVENSVCGRGARRVAKKSGCSCCNGAGELPVTRKRTAAQIHMQAPQKKAFLGKKR